MSAKRTKIPVEWAAIAGRWEFEGSIATYLGPDPRSPFPHGIALSSLHLRNGAVNAHVEYPENPAAHEGRIIFGYSPTTRSYYLAGMGGYGYTYVIDEFLSSRGWHALGATGLKENIRPNHPYNIDLRIRGQTSILTVDRVKVVQVDLPRPLEDDITGLFAAGPSTVRFSHFAVKARPPKVFVVMQFGEPFDALYDDVIKPVSEKIGLQAFRADEIHKPGFILKDIVTSIVESEIIVAEISALNPNVFYELGYAHAIDKTTILLAERDGPLPFDISGYRVIFYDNTIKGKRHVEDSFRKHLSSILHEP